MSSEEVKQRLQKQLPEGAVITYFTEKSEGQYEVWYTMPKERAEASRRQTLPLIGQEFVESYRQAPTFSEEQEAMQKDRSGRAIPVRDEDVLAFAVTVASLTAPYLQRKYWMTPQQKYWKAYQKMRPLYKETRLQKVGLAPSPDIEFQPNVVQETPTEQFRFPKKPFSTYRQELIDRQRLLEEAYRKSLSMGGRSAEQILKDPELVRLLPEQTFGATAESAWMPSPALKHLQEIRGVTPKIPPVSSPIGISSTATVSILNAYQKGLQRVSQISMLRSAQMTQTLQRTKLAQRLSQAMATPQRAMERSGQTSRQNRRWELPRFTATAGRRRRRLDKWYWKIHPIPEPKDINRQLRRMRRLGT